MFIGFSLFSKHHLHSVIFLFTIHKYMLCTKVGIKHDNHAGFIYFFLLLIIQETKNTIIKANPLFFHRIYIQNIHLHSHGKKAVT